MSYLLPTFAWLKNLVQGMLVQVSFFLGVLVAINSMPFAALGASVKLSWDPSSDPRVIGYNVYYGTVSRAYTNEISAGSATTVTVTNLVEGVTYYFAVTAYDDAGLESPFSNEAVYTVPLNASNQPSVLTSAKNSNGQFSFTLSGVAGSPYVIEASTNLVNWEPVLTNVAPFTFTISISSQYDRRFFRAYYSTALDPAVTPATLASARQVNGQFNFTVSGVAGYPYIVEASTNLIDWVQVATNLSPFTFTATNIGQFKQRFFRAVYLH
jgi:Fibronectin type III domain